MITKDTLKFIHKMMVDATIEHHKGIHSALNVTLTPADYDPESWFCGMPHPITGKTLPIKYQAVAVVNDTFDTIKKAGPHSIDADGRVVWSKGDGKKTYVYHRTGYEIWTGKPVLMLGFPPHPVKGKLRYDGSIGLGVFYKDAIAIWGKKAILDLTS